MLILPPYSRREDEQMQSRLSFRAWGLFQKSPRKKLKPFDKYNKRLYNIIRLQEYDKVLFMYYTVGKVRVLTDFQALASKKGSDRAYEWLNFGEQKYGTTGAQKRRVNINMKKIFEKLKSKLGKNGSPAIALLLFAAAFTITVMSIGSCTRIEIDRYQFGQTVRSIVDGEKGEVVAVINGTEYYEQDLKLMIEMLKISEPEYNSLKEDQVKSLAGNALVKQKLLLHEFDRLKLTVADDEYNEYVEKAKKEALDTIALNNDESKALTDYISGYGCTFTEYWQDEYVLASYMDNIKLDKVSEYICEQKGYSKVSSVYLEQYLTGLLNDGTYEVTLFGEEFK